MWARSHLVPGAGFGTFGAGRALTCRAPGFATGGWGWWLSNGVGGKHDNRANQMTGLAHGLAKSRQNEAM
ncbi:hypothetical protein ATKI12_0757 [Kitasatospora sp. Ki12]